MRPIFRSIVGLIQGGYGYSGILRESDWCFFLFQLDAKQPWRVNASINHNSHRRSSIKYEKFVSNAQMVPSSFLHSSSSFISMDVNLAAAALYLDSSVFSALGGAWRRTHFPSRIFHAVIFEVYRFCSESSGCNYDIILALLTRSVSQQYFQVNRALLMLLGSGSGLLMFPDSWRGSNYVWPLPRFLEVSMVSFDSSSTSEHRGQSITFQRHTWLEWDRRFERPWARTRIPFISI